MNKQQIERRVIFLSRTIRDQERATRKLENEQQGYFLDENTHKNDKKIRIKKDRIARLEDELKSYKDKLDIREFSCLCNFGMSLNDYKWYIKNGYTQHQIKFAHDALNVNNNKITSNCCKII
ncbi:MAG: hypothetical protein PUE01_00320 [Clostridiaceae bacterium]|nr:hypothetical protein [Clostridiaceae bacterium]